MPATGERCLCCYTADDGQLLRRFAGANTDEFGPHTIPSVRTGTRTPLHSEEELLRPKSQRMAEGCSVTGQSSGAEPSAAAKVIVRSLPIVAATVMQKQ